MNKLLLRKFLRLTKAFMMIALCVVLSIPFSPETYAEVEDFIDSFSANNIKFYNPDDCEDGGGGGSAVGGEAVISGTTAEQKVWSGLKSMGLSDEVVAGIMGNMKHESNEFNPAQHEGMFIYDYGGNFDLAGNEDISYGLGLIQWSFGRRIRVYNYVKEHNPDLLKYLDNPMTYSYEAGSAYAVNGDRFIEIANNEAQVDALYSLELTFLVNEELKVNEVYSGVLNETTVNGASDYFLERVEVPFDIDGQRQGRRESSNAIFQKYSGQSSFSGGTGGNGSGGSSAIISSKDDGSNVTWIGDSISVGASSTIKDQWSAVDLYAEVSKQFYGTNNSNPTGEQLVSQIEAKGQMREVLVLALGTNNSGMNESEVKNVLSLAKSAKTIVLVTNYKKHDDGAYAANNELLKRMKDEDSRVSIADWAGVASADPDQYYDGDTIHPNSAGTELFVKTIIDAASTGYTQGSGDDYCICEEVSKSGVWAGKKYDLTDRQVAGLLAVIKAESGQNLEAIKTYATMMPNMFEYYEKDSVRTSKALIEYVLKSNKFASNATALYNEKNTDYAQNEFSAVKDILVNGNRTMPPEIVISGCINCKAGIEHAYNENTEIDKTDRDQFISGKTKLVQNNDGRSESWIFYKFADDQNKTGNPFGFFENNPPGDTSKSTSTTAGAGVTWTDGWIAGGLSGYVKDDATTWGYELDPASNSAFATTNSSGNAGANKILLRSAETSGVNRSTLKTLYQPSQSTADGKRVSRAPHFTVDMRNRKIYQHYSINKTAGAVKSHDNIAGIQIGIIGYTSDDNINSSWNLRSSYFSDEDWDYLAKLIIALSEETGAELDGSKLDWTDAHQKLSVDEMRSYSGIMGDMHVPGSNSINPKDIWQFLEPAIERGGAGDGECVITDTNGDINATAILLAWPTLGDHGPDDPTEAYRKALLEPDGVGARGEGDICSITGKSCDAFVATVMRYSGVDKDMPCCIVDTLTEYMDAHPEKYKRVSNAKEDLRGGDIRAYADNGHIQVIVEVDGEIKIAHASHCDRTGEIGGYYESPGAPVWRYIGPKAKK